MLFNTVEFFIFFGIVYTIYRMLDMLAQNRMLLLASYIFYGWWDVRFLYLVVLSTGLDYCCGLLLGPGRIPLRDRLKVSACLVLAALCFVTLRWDRVNLSASAPTYWSLQPPFSGRSGSTAENCRASSAPTGWAGWCWPGRSWRSASRT